MKEPFFRTEAVNHYLGAELPLIDLPTVPAWVHLLFWGLTVATCAGGFALLLLWRGGGAGG
jgi:hypothetical protein